MTDDLTLIEKISQMQAEVSSDLELLKQSDSVHADDIEGIIQHQQMNIEAIEILREKIQSEQFNVEEQTDVND